MRTSPQTITSIGFEWRTGRSATPLFMPMGTIISLFTFHYYFFFVSLASPKILTFGNTQINLVFRSLIRIFARKEINSPRKNQT